MMRNTIRKILKETTASNELLKIINKEGIFSVAKLVGGIENLKHMFKHNPEVLERIGGANGKVSVDYSVDYCPCITLDFDIVDERWNKWYTNSWAEVNVKYDESKLTSEEINIFNAYIIDTFDQEGSFDIIHFDCPELEKKRADNFLTLVEINGVSKERSSTLYGRYERKSKGEIMKIINKLKK